VRPRPRRSWLTGTAIAVTAITVATVGACGGGEPGIGAGTGATARTYQVRGVLIALPDPATGAGQLRVRHEAIPDLVGASGEVEGMPAMTMPFPVAEALDLAGFAAGDAVRLDLRIDWDAARPVEVTAIEKLPAGTTLTLD